jgi:D-galactarolactone isomerase
MQLNEDRMNRRKFCAALGGSALAASLPGCAGPRTVLAEATEQQVPFSSGVRPPKLKTPANACDSHMHIFDPRFPASSHWKGQLPDNAPVSVYRLFQKRIGTTRTVVVTPSTYGIDNRSTVDAVAQLGATGCGVAVVDTSVSDHELKRLAESGIRGIRVNFVSPQSWGTTTPEMLETLSKRVNDLGWHVQIYAMGDQIVQMENVLRRLPTPLVFDHLGRLPQPAGVAHPAFGVIRKRLDEGRTWVKLSGAYLNTKIGPPYRDVTPVAQAFVKAVPERMVWGSDWPHRGEKEMPDDALLLDLLLEWAPDDAMRRRILVDNPEALYGFPKSG